VFGCKPGHVGGSDGCELVDKEVNRWKKAGKSGADKTCGARKPYCGEAGRDVTVLGERGRADT
jgi:hypothetical protein